MIERVKEKLYKDWGNYFPDRPKASSIRYFLTRGSNGKHAKASFLLFADDDREPFCVVKVPIFDEGSEFLQNEHDILHRLRALNAPAGGPAAPRCWLISGLERRPVLIQEAFTAVPLRKLIRRENRVDLLRLGVESISNLHQATRVDHLFSKEDYVKFVAEPVQNALKDEKYRPVKASLDQMALRLEGLIEEKIPLVLCHHDFRVSNIRIEGEKLQLFDWEFAQWPGLPIVDVLNFIVDYHAERNLIDFGAAFTEISKNNLRGFTGEIGSLLEQYCVRMGLNKALIPLWMDLFLVQKLLLAQRIIFPVQVFDGVEWAKNLDRLISSRNTDGGIS
jgi:hypothetical protein